MGATPQAQIMVWGLQTQPKRWSTGGVGELLGQLLSRNHTFLIIQDTTPLVAIIPNCLSQIASYGYL